MKLSSAFLALALAAFSFAPSAHAATIALTSPSFDMGTLTAGDSGTIDASSLISPSGYLSFMLTGNLGVNSLLTFSFAFPDGTINTFDMHQVSYSYGGIDPLKPTYYGGASASSFWAGTSLDSGSSAGYQYNAATDKYDSTTSLVLASSHLASASEGETSVKNNAGDLARFLFALTALDLTKGAPDISYSVAAVPLPAALPLFGLGFAGLVGLRSRKRRSEA